MKKNNKETFIGLIIIAIGILAIYLFHNNESELVNIIKTLLIFLKDWIYKIIVLIMLYKIYSKLKNNENK